MTNLSGNLRHTLGNPYGLRTWIENGFKHSKNELGWADYRLTDYPAIERWWELVFSAYLMVSLHTPVLQTPTSPLKPLCRMMALAGVTASCGRAEPQCV
jgi:hypothetical protein